MPRFPISASIAIISQVAGPVHAQPAIFHGPIVGFVYASSSRSVRPVLGVPGAAIMGSPVLSDVDHASIAPGGKWALVSKGGSVRFVRGLSDKEPSESAAEGLIDSVDRVVWNGEGTSALLFS